MSKNRANLFKSIRQSRDVDAPELEIEESLEEAKTPASNPADLVLETSTPKEGSSVANFPIERVKHPRQPDPQTAQQDDSASAPQPKKRGRPATGKRSDPDWIGRTFYVKKETDLDVEGELFQLKRQGMEIDKSELVDSLLYAWVKWRNSKNSDFPTGEILPIQNDENP